MRKINFQKEPLKIRIRRIHIKNGVQCKSTECPFALAVEDALIDMGYRNFSINVSSVNISVRIHHGRQAMSMLYSLPNDAIYWILNFDNSVAKIKAKVASFDLGLPSRYIS